MKKQNRLDLVQKIKYFKNLQKNPGVLDTPKDIEEKIKNAEAELVKIDAQIALEVKNFNKNGNLNYSLGAVNKIKSELFEQEYELKKSLVIATEENRIYFRLMELKSSAIPEYMTFEAWGDKRLLEAKGHEKYKQFLILKAWNCAREMQRFQDTMAEITSDLVQFNLEKNKLTLAEEKESLIEAQIFLAMVREKLNNIGDVQDITVDRLCKDGIVAYTNSMGVRNKQIETILAKLNGSSVILRNLRDFRRLMDDFIKNPQSDSINTIRTNLGELSSQIGETALFHKTIQEFDQSLDELLNEIGSHQNIAQSQSSSIKQKLAAITSKVPQLMKVLNVNFVKIGKLCDEIQIIFDKYHRTLIEVTRAYDGVHDTLIQILNRNYKQISQGQKDRDAQAAHIMREKKGELFAKRYELTTAIAGYKDYYRWICSAQLLKTNEIPTHGTLKEFVKKYGLGSPQVYVRVLDVGFFYINCFLTGTEACIQITKDIGNLNTLDKALEIDSLRLGEHRDLSGNSLRGDNSIETILGLKYLPLEFMPPEKVFLTDDSKIEGIPSPDLHEMITGLGVFLKAIEQEIEKEIKQTEIIADHIDNKITHETKTVDQFLLFLDKRSPLSQTTNQSLIRKKSEEDNKIQISIRNLENQDLRKLTFLESGVQQGTLVKGGRMGQGAENIDVIINRLMQVVNYIDSKWKKLNETISCNLFSTSNTFGLKNRRATNSGEVTNYLKDYLYHIFTPLNEIIKILREKQKELEEFYKKTDALIKVIDNQAKQLVSKQQLYADQKMLTSFLYKLPQPKNNKKIITQREKKSEFQLEVNSVVKQTLSSQEKLDKLLNRIIADLAQDDQFIALIGTLLSINPRESLIKQMQDVQKAMKLYNSETKAIKLDAGKSFYEARHLLKEWLEKKVSKDDIQGFLKEYDEKMSKDHLVIRSQTEALQDAYESQVNWKAQVFYAIYGNLEKSWLRIATQKDQLQMEVSRDIAKSPTLSIEKALELITEKDQKVSGMLDLKNSNSNKEDKWKPYSRLIESIEGRGEQGREKEKMGFYSR